MSKNTTLKLENLTIGYAKPLINNIYLEAEQGSLIALIGRNGGGKSTLINTILKNIKPISGEIKVCDMPLSSLSHQQLSKLISVVFTSKVEVEFLKVREVLQMGRMPYQLSSKWMDKDGEMIVNGISQTMGLQDLLDKEMNKISDGQHQKVMIARALIQSTPIVLLDEPTSFLDYPSKHLVFEELRNICLNLQKTIIVSTHDIDLVGEYTDCFWVVNEDKIEEVRGSSKLVKSKLNFHESI